MLPTTDAPALVIEVSPFVAADAQALTPTDRSADALKYLPNIDEAYRAYERDGGWTLRVGGVVVGCAGIQPMWRGVANAWLLPSPRLAFYPKTVALAVVLRLRDLIESQELRRVQCSVEATFATGRRFVEWMGFQPEGLMRGYGPNGADHVLYAWIREETPSDASAA